MSKPTGKLIRLTAGDVGAYTKTEADTKIADAKKTGTDANTNANGRVPTSRKVNGKPLTADISLTAGDVSAYTKTEADTKIADAKKAGTDANTNANGRVPTSRKINGKPLTADISLTAGDVSAYTKTETDTKVADAKKAGTDANANANGRVPTSRKINGKPLTADISLTAGDVGALTQDKADNRYEIKGHDPQYKYITAYSGAGMKDNQTIALPQDCRGCWFYFNDAEGVITSAAYLPDDNVEVGINSGASGNARIRLENSGKTFRCVWGGVGGAPSKIRVRVRA